MVVLHTTVGTWSGTIDWFGRPESRVSSHYLVGLDGRIAQFVDEADTARHAGKIREPSAELVIQRGGNPNAYSIGIEFEDGGHPHDVARPAAQYASGAHVVAAAAARWSIPIDRRHVVGHREITVAKECPGNLDVDRVVADAAELQRL
ncbi:MAG: N-acetylmuramoyl-L-alanine amidase [Actinomycetota bacterium]|nr:N-acetylmuramoyl-L-alanine amidase [Actinomycetota bacterium]